jgi:uncharacterized protein YukE
MSSMKLELEEIRAVAKELINTHQDMSSQLKAMKSKVDATTNNSFITPKSSGAFNASYEQFTTGTQQALDGMEGMAKWLEGAVDGFEGLDEQLASSMG